MGDDYRLEPLGVEEGEALTKELQEVLERHGAEMQVTSNIQLLKRVPVGENVPTSYNISDEKSSGEEETSSKEDEGKKEPGDSNS